MSDRISVRRALVSVSDRTGLVEFVQALAAKGIEIVSTGGTAQALRNAGISVRDVSDVTGFPEIMDGRVKTLHPRIHGGILARRTVPAHGQAMEEHGIPPIDLVVVNLYPFAQTLASGASYEDCVEKIDIGGPALIRASAKNHESVAIVTNPADYAEVLAELTTDGATSLDLRRRLAARAYAHTSAYDARIADWLRRESGEGDLPREISFAGSLASTMRYGENPHQKAALYLDGSSRPGAATATFIQGKELSYNNINDTDAAFELVSEFDEPAVAIIKHANPCGVAIGASSLEAYRLALRCDPVSAFGGIIALNRPLDAETAAEIIKVFSEVIIAPKILPEALPILKAKDKVRVLETGSLADPAAHRLTVRTVAGGLLVQDADSGRLSASDLKVVTKRAPTESELRDLLFAFRVGKHVKSNAIVYAKDSATVGIGAGQMSRLDSSRIAARKAEDAAQFAKLPESLAIGSVVASDAFFPFADGLIAAAEAGVTAIIQPGGSIRDADVIAAADERGLAMVFTGMRHFRH